MLEPAPSGLQLGHQTRARLWQCFGWRIFMAVITFCSLLYWTLHDDLFLLRRHENVLLHGTPCTTGWLAGSCFFSWFCLPDLVKGLLRWFLGIRVRRPFVGWLWWLSFLFLLLHGSASPALHATRPIDLCRVIFFFLHSLKKTHWICSFLTRVMFVNPKRIVFC